MVDADNDSRFSDIDHYRRSIRRRESSLSNAMSTGELYSQSLLWERRWRWWVFHPEAAT